MSRNFEITLEYEEVPGKRPTRAEYEAKLGSSISSKDTWPSFAPISNGARALYKDFASELVRLIFSIATQQSVQKKEKSRVVPGKEFAPVTGVKTRQSKPLRFRKLIPTTKRIDAKPSQEQGGFRLPHASCDTETEGQNCFQKRRKTAGEGRDKVRRAR